MRLFKEPRDARIWVSTKHFFKGPFKDAIVRRIIPKSEPRANHILLRVGIPARIRFDDVHLLIKRRQNIQNVGSGFVETVEYFQHK